MLCARGVFFATKNMRADSNHHVLHPHTRQKTTFKAHQPMHRFLWLLVHAVACAAIGMTIQPTLAGDKSKLLLLLHLHHCVSYHTSKDDIIMVSVHAGDRVSLQRLNLRVFDNDDNLLRATNDVSNDLTFIFTNLNSPVQVESELVARDETEGRLLIHVCFDNVYFDRLWSFQKQVRDVELKVSIRNKTSLQRINYNNFARYFQRASDLDMTKVKNNEIKQDFTEDDFERAVQELSALLLDISDELSGTESGFESLMDAERALRAANEDIFEKFTRHTLAVIASICCFGLFQVVYFKCYLKRNKIV